MGGSGAPAPGAGFPPLNFRRAPRPRPSAAHNGRRPAPQKRVAPQRHAGPWALLGGHRLAVARLAAVQTRPIVWQGAVC